MNMLISAIYQKRRVVIPILFYPCVEGDISHFTHDVMDRDKFFVVTHINTLFAYPTPNRNDEITIERYEPSCCGPQGNLDDVLRVMFRYWFDRQKKNIFNSDAQFNWVPTESICPYGTQYILKDQELCQYHILWWMKHRLFNDFYNTYIQVIQQFDKKQFLDFVSKIQENEKLLDK